MECWPSETTPTIGTDTRPESRRILLVLTDGKAGCEGSGEAAMNHARHVAGRIARTGIEPVGVGILDESIREVVADSIVIHTPKRPSAATKAFLSGPYSKSGVLA
jgi:hypothetical protein